MTGVMRRSKLVAHSAALGRDFHADVFEVGEAPQVLVVMFGGSGMTQGEYETRAATIVPVFDRALTDLASDHSFVFVYVTAPYDVPFGQFGQFEDEPEAAERWTRHVVDELLPRWPTPPVYFIGYSGGAALALCGPHDDARCVGVGGLGADGLPEEFEEGERWGEPLRLYYCVDDRVYGTNAEVIKRLEDEGVAQCLRQGRGGHALSAYLASGGWGGLVRHACRLARAAGAPA